MQTTCCRKLRFCAGHRVLGHENKCASWHGHDYLCEIEAAADSLDRIGRVIDFSVLKDRIGGWIDAHWDHGFIYYELDEEMAAIAAGLGPKHKSFPLPSNPTAENIASYLLNVICPRQLEGTGVRVIMVTVHETPNCYARVSINERENHEIV